MNFLKNIAQWYYRRYHRIRTDSEVNEFYQDLITPFDLRTKLNTMGYQWQGELSFLDWNKTPAESLASRTRQINCGDFMMFYTELFKKLGIEHQCFLLENQPKYFWDYDWHFISTFKFENELWLQTNNDLGKIISNDVLLLKFPQYAKIQSYQP